MSPQDFDAYIQRIGLDAQIKVALAEPVEDAVPVHRNGDVGTQRREPEQEREGVVPYALDRIQDEPHAADQRMRRPDGAWVDYGAVGLLIAYEVLEPDRIRLLAVTDIKKEHRW